MVVFALFSAATAQDAAPPSHTPAVLHESYYNVPLLDLIPGGRLFRAHAVPVLQEMVEAGSVYAWYEAEMPIGNASNLYLAVVLRDSLALAEFRQLLPRVAQRAGAAGDTLARLMTPEREELWEIVSIRMPSPAAEAMWLQHRMFDVSTAQPDNWRGFLDEMTTPVRERSMDGGVLDGWIELKRRDGDRHTSKFLEWFGGWEDIDEFGESFFAGLAADVQRATDWARAVERMRLEIWRYLPRNSQALPAGRSGGAAQSENPAAPGAGNQAPHAFRSSEHTDAALADAARTRRGPIAALLPALRETQARGVRRETVATCPPPPILAGNSAGRMTNHDADPIRRNGAADGARSAHSCAQSQQAYDSNDCDAAGDVAWLPDRPPLVHFSAEDRVYFSAHIVGPEVDMSRAIAFEFVRVRLP